MRGKFDFLRERAEQFFDDARHNLQQKNLEICAFDLEQSCQLFLKYTIGIKLGDFPHVHNLMQLMKAVSRTLNDEDFATFYINNKRVIEILEKAYFDARYYDTQFEISEIESMINFTKELREKLQASWS